MLKEKNGSIIYLVGVKSNMKNREIGFLSVMMAIQLPFVAAVEALFIYLFLERIFKNIKDHHLTMTIPMV